MKKIVNTPPPPPPAPINIFINININTTWIKTQKTVFIMKKISIWNLHYIFLIIIYTFIFVLNYLEKQILFLFKDLSYLTYYQRYAVIYMLIKMYSKEVNGFFFLHLDNNPQHICNRLFSNIIVIISTSLVL